jgi:hypothetical protein
LWSQNLVMINWFTVKLKYTKQLEDGTLKRVTEPYMLSGMTFTDAEARIYEELGTTIRGEFLVTGIARTDIQEIFPFDGSNLWYKCKISYESADADGGKSKKITQLILVEAGTVKEAYDNLAENMSNLMVDYKVISVAESPIIEVFYPKEDEKRVEPSKDSSVKGMTPNTDFVAENEAKHVDELEANE